MRLFSVTKATPLNQIGDNTPGFALQTFFPDKIQPTIEKVCERAYNIANSCGFIVMMQNCLKKKKIRRANKKAESRKKALEMLDEEIQKKQPLNDTDNADEESVVLKKDIDKKDEVERDANGWRKEAEEKEPDETEEFEISFQGDEETT